MYIIRKTELQGVGVGYQMETNRGEDLLLIHYLDGRYEMFFCGSNKEIVSLLLEQNEVQILAQLLNPDQGI